MKLLFLRHAKALNREEFMDDDLLRPLTNKGIKISKEFFKKISNIFDIDIIISSKATRAYQTAKILQQFYPNVPLKTTRLLNPGATFFDIKTIIDDHKEYEKIVLVGHEPDFSEAIAKILGCSFLSIDIKKSSFIELEGDSLDNLELKSFIHPKIFINKKQKSEL